MESNEHVLCKYQAVYCQPPGQFGTAPRSRGSPIDAAAAVCSQPPPLAINLASAAEGGGGFNSDKSQAQFFFIRVICCPHCVKWEQKQSRGRLSATVAPLAAGFRVLNNFWSVGNNLKLFQWNIIILIFQSAWEWQHIGTCSWRITLCCFWRRAESGDGWSSLLLP